MRILISILSALLFLHCHSTKPPVNKITTEGFTKNFIDIASERETISFNNSLPVNNQGGHLQGIQLISKGQHQYAVLSGSSSTYSYYAIAKLGKEKKVIQIHKILDKPYKHAGGIQIYQNLMAIGVEDNDAKDRSKVFIFQINDPELLPEAPLAIIDRKGNEKRATAGSVGLIEMNNYLLLVVGDWDSKHLDFYTAPYSTSNLQTLTFKKVYTIDTEKTDRSKWIDQAWLSYQNINFIKDDQENIYLVGMAGNIKGQDVADLFLLRIDNMQSFQLKKIASKNFGTQEKTKFRWGAGITQTNDGKIRITSCGENLWDESFLTTYKNEK